MLSDFLWRTIVCQPNIRIPEVKKGNRTWEVMYLSRTLPSALLLVISVHLAQSLPHVAKHYPLLDLRVPHGGIMISFWANLFLLSAFWSRCDDKDLHLTRGKELEQVALEEGRKPMHPEGLGEAQELKLP